MATSSRYKGLAMLYFAGIASRRVYRIQCKKLLTDSRCTTCFNSTTISIIRIIPCTSEACCYECFNNLCVALERSCKDITTDAMMDAAHIMNQFIFSWVIRDLDILYRKREKTLCGEKMLL